MVAAKQLHLPDLAIEGFRGIEKLSIPRLGRVTLLAGKNAVGKTTILDAVRVYASRCNYRVLRDLLTGREDWSAVVDEEGHSFPEPDWSALFHGRRVAPGSRMGVRSGDDELGRVHAFGWVWCMVGGWRLHKNSMSVWRIVSRPSGGM